MTRYSILRSAAFLILSALLNPISSRAEFIQPVAVQASNGEDTADALINGNGFDDSTVGSPQSTHVRSNGEMWSVIGSIKADAIFDLGKTVDLTKVYLWNYNVQDATDVGMKDVEVQVSSSSNMTNATFTTIAKIQLKEGGEGAQVFDVVGTTVRLVKLKGLSNWGQGYSVGLAEARFESGDITGEVPVLVLNNPHEGDVIPSGKDLTLDATITDKDNNLLKAEFFDGDKKLGEVAASPFTFLVKTPSIGDHSFRVVATDKTGKVGWVTADCTVREFVADRIEQIDDNANISTTLDLGKIKYTGTWTLAPGNANDPRFMNNDHYSDVKNSYFEVKFKGVRIDIFATVASHHGTGIASIDGGTEYNVVYKAAQRKEQVLVWSSPILANKEHVLKIRVAGNGVVTADRFDIQVSDKPDVVSAAISKVTPAVGSLVVELQDAPASVINPATVKLFVDDALVLAALTKSPPITTITYLPAPPFAVGSSHVIRVEAKDGAGNSVTNQAAFSLPKPFFPLTGLGAPYSTAGNWGFRQVWNAGRADALVSAVDIALGATQTGFGGKVFDGAVPVINFRKTANPGGGGLIPDDQPLPAEAAGLSESDFVVLARARVRIPRAGDWTIGVHSDEGFALRFVGAPFASVSGVGEIDENFPEYIGVQNNSGDSNTRGVLKNLAAGTYEIQFISWERVGAAYYEIYAAEGAFEEDGATDQWTLIGAAGGLEIVASGPNLATTTVARQGDKVLIDFVTPSADGTHTLQESSDLKNWNASTGVTFEKKGANALRASVNGSSTGARFYRVMLP